MDKKEKKRDVSSFTYNLKEMMNDPLDNPLTTLDRDLQHFLYGRLAILIKHNEGQPIGSLTDVGTVVGASLANVVLAFCQNRTEDQDLDELFDSVKSGIMYGFDARLSANRKPADETTSTEEVLESTEEVPVE